MVYICQKGVRAIARVFAIRLKRLSTAINNSYCLNENYMRKAMWNNKKQSSKAVMFLEGFQISLQKVFFKDFRPERAQIDIVLFDQ